MANITLEKLEANYQKAKEDYEYAQMELTSKKEAFEKIQGKRNKRMCKELETLLSHFYLGMHHSDIFFEAFYELDSLGADSQEVLFGEFEKVEFEEDKFRAIQIHRVDYDEYEHEVIIPTNIPFKSIKEIFDKYLEKEKEYTKKEEENKKAMRYAQYLELKKEFESP